MNMEELTIAIRVSAENVEETIDGIRTEMEKLGVTVDGVSQKGNPYAPFTDGAGEAAAAQAALAAATSAAFLKIAGAVTNGVAAYNAFTSATKGLESIAAGRGIDQSALSDALDSVTDAFFSASAAATAYKNLLTRGYSLDQATTTITRLKDAAAFGRAANLSLEEAVVSATEGIRQENSVLVDNAGVTKNVAKMWEDYAKARGLSTTSLTQSQKVEAEYLGILNETQLQAGDLAKASETLAGKQAENAAQATKLATAYGEALAPAVETATTLTTGLFSGLTAIVSGMPEVSAGVTAAAAAMTLYVGATKAAAAAQTLFGAAATAFNPVLAAVAAGIGVVVAAYTAWQNAQDEARKAQEAAAQAAQEEQKAREEQLRTVSEEKAELQKLSGEYKTLCDTQNRTALQNERMKRIAEQLSTQYGISESALQSLAEGYDSGNDAIVDRIRLYQQEQIEMLKKQKLDKQSELDQKKNDSIVGQLNAGGEPDFDNASNWIRDEYGNLLDDTGWKTTIDNWLAYFYDKQPEVLQAAQGLHDALYNAQSLEEAKAAYDTYFEGLQAQSEETSLEIEALTDEINAIDEAIANIETFDPDKSFSGSTGVGESSAGTSGSSEEQDMLSAYQQTLDAVVELDAALREIAVLQDEGATAEEKRAAALALAREGYGYLLGDAQAISATQEAMLTQASALTEAYNTQREALEAEREALEQSYLNGDISYEEYQSKASQILAALEQTASGAVTASLAMNQLSNGLDDVQSEEEKAAQSAQDLTRKLQNMSALKAQVTQYKALATQTKQAGGTWADLTDEVKGFGKQLGVADGDLDGLISGLGGLESQLSGTMQGGVADLQSMIAQLEAMRAELLSIPPAQITADNSQALGAINTAIAAANALLALFGQAGLDTGTETVKRGGGGGSSRSSAEEAAREAERAQEEAYQSELSRIEHRRHMGEITAQEEIAELERVKREYARTAEQIMDIDERIYDARQALREREEEKITALGDAITQALENRYEEQRRIEQQRITDSIAAWQTWSDETCKAIQAQIDALDEQAQAEDREAVKAQNLRKIDSLQQALAYEKDEYNRSQLQKQIEQAQADWEKTQKDWAREDERKALEDQMQAVQDQAQQEIGKLEEESARIDSVFDELVSGASLAAEAQKMLMQSSQDDLLALLTSYAPDYEATGRTLGEKLYAGFAQAVGNIHAWFEQIDSRFEQMTDAAQQAAFGTTGALQASGADRAQVSAAPVIQQTVNFNQPVESAADVTRRMQQVSRALADML